MQNTAKLYFTYILTANIMLSYFFKSFSLSKMFHAKLPPGSHFRHPISSFCTERHSAANKQNTLMHFFCSCTPGTSLALLHNNIMYLREASIYNTVSIIKLQAPNGLTSSAKVCSKKGGLCLGGHHHKPG